MSPLPSKNRWERDPIPYALETDWPVGAGGFEPSHQERARWAYRYCAARRVAADRAPDPAAGASTISRHFERDPIPYALETDWPVGAAGFEPLHIESEFAKTPSRGAGLELAHLELKARPIDA